MDILDNDSSFRILNNIETLDQSSPVAQGMLSSCESGPVECRGTWPVVPAVSSEVKLVPGVVNRMVVSGSLSGDRGMYGGGGGGGVGNASDDDGLS